MTISEEQKSAAKEWFNYLMANCPIKISECQSSKTIRALLSPAPERSKVDEAVKLFNQTAVFLMPENKKYKDALDTLIQAATQKQPDVEGLVKALEYVSIHSKDLRCAKLAQQAIAKYRGEK